MMPGSADLSGRKQMRHPVRVAVVGLGYWGPNLVRNLYELGEAEVAYVCDLRHEALDAIRHRYPAIATTTRFSDVLKDPRVDAVAIATPVATHYELAACALEAGKHVFVEKPLAGSSHEARALITLAKEQGRVLMPGHTFLYSPPVNMVGELVHRGELGDVYFISMSRVNLGLHQPDVSVVWDLGPHDFSILQFWLQELPVRVSAISRCCVLPDTPDVAFVNLEYASGTIAHVELSWLAPSKLRRTTIVGTQKMVLYDDTSNEPVRIFDSGVTLPEPRTFGEYRLTYRAGDVVSPRIDAGEPLRLEFQDFCAAVRENRPPRATAELGLKVVSVVEAVDASLERGGAPVELEAEQRPAAAPVVLK